MLNAKDAEMSKTRGSHIGHSPAAEAGSYPSLPSMFSIVPAIPHRRGGSLNQRWMNGGPVLHRLWVQERETDKEISWLRWCWWHVSVGTQGREVPFWGQVLILPSLVSQVPPFRVDDVIMLKGLVN